MSIFNIISTIKTIENKESVFLLETLSGDAGFFSHESHLLYVAKDIYDYPYECIETDYLRLETHIHISSVKNYQTFEDDNYNIIFYKGELTDSNIESFIKLCRVHASNMDEIRFKEFFYSLIALFQLPSEQSYKNAVGLYGELKFMMMVQSVYGHDISKSWHKKGSTSQYDFTNGKESIEIKTTATEKMNVAIKHQQIFGEHPCWLVTVVCEQYENGETIDEVIAEINQVDNAFNGINFSINLAKELKRVSSQDVKELRFHVSKYQMFDTKNINPFKSIPDAVDELEYRLDVSNMDELASEQINELIIQF